jgi:arginine:ornithine antiporter/lysine permease
MRQPSMAGVLLAVVGNWGGIFVSAGLIVSVLGAYLAWTLITIEVLFAAAKSGDMPKILATENSNGVPAAALWLTNVVIQLFLLSTLLSDDAFALMVQLTSSLVLIPYLLVAAYGFLLAGRGETYEMTPAQQRRDFVVAGIAVLYAAFMIYAGGLKFVLLSAVLYAPGTILFFRTRREQGRRIFTRAEWVVFVAVTFGGIVGVYSLVTGAISL